MICCAQGHVGPSRPFVQLQAINDARSLARRVIANLSGEFNLEASISEPTFVEEELKFAVQRDDALELPGRLPMRFSASVYETNYMVDTREEVFRRANSRLRLRLSRDLFDETISRVVIAWKMPLSTGANGLKREEEIEAEVNRYPIAVLLAKLRSEGFDVITSYEKIRHSFLIGDSVKVEFDVLPDIGRFLELEGAAEALQNVVSLLGLDSKVSVPLPYDTIHADQRTESGLEEKQHILFEESVLPGVLADEQVFLLDMCSKGDVHGR